MLAGVVRHVHGVDDLVEIHPRRDLPGLVEGGPEADAVARRSAADRVAHRVAERVHLRLCLGRQHLRDSSRVAARVPAEDLADHVIADVRFGHPITRPTPGPSHR